MCVLSRYLSPVVEIWIILSGMFCQFFVCKSGKCLANQNITKNTILGVLSKLFSPKQIWSAEILDDRSKLYLVDHHDRRPHKIYFQPWCVFVCGHKYHEPFQGSVIHYRNIMFRKSKVIKFFFCWGIVISCDIQQSN